MKKGNKFSQVNAEPRGVLSPGFLPFLTFFLTNRSLGERLLEFEAQSLEKKS